MLFAWLSIIAGTAFALGWRAADIAISRTFPEHNLQEAEPWARGKGGKFVEWRAWAFTLGPIGVAWGLFLFIPESKSFTDGTYWPAWVCGPVAAVGGVPSMIAWADTRQKIRERRERKKVQGGVL